MIAWHRDLETASSTSEVLRTAQAFLASLAPTQRATLPHDIVQAPLADAQDLREFGDKLNAAYWARRHSGEDPGVLEALWGFFLRASIQLSRIEAGVQRMPSDSRSRQAA